MRGRIFIFSLIFSTRLFAQGGPPMITDDPGTPGNGKWEINLATAFEHRPGETSFDAPAIDLNYGVGEHVQLTLQTAPVVLKRRDHGAVGGLGSVEAALKWRFLDEENAGFDVSIFPRVIFNVLQSSERRGLSEPGRRVQCPVQIEKKVGPVALDFEAGLLASSVGRAELLYGVVAGVELSKTTNVMAELHGTSPTSLDQDALVVNVGLRHVISDHQIFIASLGHEVRSPSGEALALIGYCGVQILY